MKLYTFPRAPHCRKVDIVLLEKGQDQNVERVSVNLAEKENLQPPFKTVNPRSVVPVLALDSGLVIDESLAICRYLETLFPEPALFGSSPEQSAEIASWERHMEFDGYLPAQEAFRNSHPAMAQRGVAGFGSEFPAIPALAERAIKRFGLFLKSLEQRLASSAYVGGAQFSIADITAVLAIDTARRSELEIPAHLNHTQSWYKTMYERPSIASTYVPFK